ncbi:transporter substrate-binding domain-containing protein [Wukongibacter sp. M2B1]|uniref:transporter substrate-binding domain-containing protein n=1 Tax=Wukongibacter sp. M2B1 TaxID=3088895 RepID=UPI003D7B08CA
MKRTIIFTVVMLIAVFTLNAFAGVKLLEEREKSCNKIIVGTSGDYAPYTYMDRDGELTGFDIEVWKEISKRLDKEVEFINVDFRNLFPMLDKGEIDTIANQITLNGKRIGKYYFADTYVYGGSQLIVRDDNTSIKGLKDLIGKKVGLIQGSSFEDTLREYDFNNEIEIRVYDNNRDYFKDIASGKLDAILEDSLVAIKAINDLKLNLKLVGEPVEVIENSFPFVQNVENEDILREVNNAIATMKRDGTLKELSQKCFSIDITSKKN